MKKSNRSFWYMVKIRDGFNHGFVGFAIVSAGVSPDGKCAIARVWWASFKDFFLFRTWFDCDDDLH